jgi:aminomethyltransferase
MPLLYSGILEEHRWVRAQAGLFDVSHMGEIAVRGPHALDFVSHVTANDPRTLAEWQVQYSLFLNERGGVVDDLLVYRLPEEFLLVVNASNTEKDLAWMRSQDRFDVEIVDVSEKTSEIALQGPRSESILQPLADAPLSELRYYWSKRVKVLGRDVLLSRTGYTGEDGFEMYGDAETIAEVAEALLETEDVKPVGLGARDTLRLEMGYPLYGHELDEDIDVYSAGLGWVFKADKPDFIGKAPTLQKKEEGRSLARVGLVSKARGGIPRDGQDVLKDGVEVGRITSGTFSPSLNVGIAMAYVSETETLPGNALEIGASNRIVPTVVRRLPIYREGTVRVSHYR